MCLLLSALLWRLIDLNILQRHFLLRQSEARILRTLSIPANRGMITDRLDTPLAISTPVYAVWANPKICDLSTKQYRSLAQYTKRSSRYLRRRIESARKREFVYLRRGLMPNVAMQIKSLRIPCIALSREYKRFYPEGEVTAHVVGITNIDDNGQEGIELAFNEWLSGKPGKKEVIKDRLGRVIENIAVLRKPQKGKSLQLSIDHRIQYLAYRALLNAVKKYRAKSGSIVVLDAHTGEVLAMANQPSYNPNRRPKTHDGRYRNRSVTDLFEPGSTIKPFTMALALTSEQYDPMSIIDTNPGWMVVGGYKIRDDGLNHGRITLTQVLQKSSNIGAAKILMSLEPDDFWKLLHRFGFGERTMSGFPGETAGTLVERTTWQPSVVATLAYGYGIAVTSLQLAHAYQILANKGVSVPVSLLKINKPVEHEKIVDPKIAKEILSMLETVTHTGGTGTRAAVRGYRVAGKTGTAYLPGPGGYDKHRYVSSFVGVAPASHPRLVIAVVVRDPKTQHFGGLVAAPVFSKVMSASLRLLGVAPDADKPSRAY